MRSFKLEPLIKCYEITPSPDHHFDSIIVEAGDTWDAALEQVESALESQFGSRVWDEISVTIKCVYRTREQLDELNEE